MKNRIYSALDRPRTYVVGMLCLVALVVLAANPSLTDFNANQFGTGASSSGTDVSIKSGVLLTNATVYQGLTGGGTASATWTMNAGTGLGGFTNYSGGYFQSNAVAGSMPTIYLGTNGGGTFGGLLTASSGFTAPGAGAGSEAYGSGATATGASSTSCGSLAKASANGATAFGELAQATGTSSTALGLDTLASATFSMALGATATSSVPHQIVVGTSAETTLFPGNTLLTGSTNSITGDLGVGGTIYDGTLIVTNPPVLNLSSSTNLPGTQVNIVWGSGTTASTNSGQVTVTAAGGAPDISTFVQTVALFDDFIGGVFSGIVPMGPLELRQTASGGSTSALGGSSVAPGIMTLNPGNAGAGQFCLISSGGASALYPYNLTGVFTNEYRFYIPNTNNPGVVGSNHMYLLGFGDMFNATLPNNGVYFQYDTNNTNPQFVTSVAGSRFTNDTAIVLGPLTNTWIKFRIVFTASPSLSATNIVLSSVTNGVAGKSVTINTAAQIPSGKQVGLNVMSMVPGTDTSGGVLGVDYIYLGYKLEAAR